MVDREKALTVVVLALLIYPNQNFGGAFQPEFLSPIANLTVARGRDATFTCLVSHLGGYRVGWVKADTKAIQAIHDHVITHNPRVSVSHGDHSTWSLHIRGVQLEDAGVYMCQINTDPMKSQTGTLSVQVPPEFVDEETSRDVMISEGGQVKLTCRAQGIPTPRVMWRREGGREIIIREAFGASTLGQKTRGKADKNVRMEVRKWMSAKSIHVSSVAQFQGEILKLTKITRGEMGAYLCIASNGVPPSISKRITVNVHFPPVIHVPNQLVGAPLGTDVALECFVEAFPKSINYWVKDNAMIISSSRHEVQALANSTFEVRMTLTIRNLQKQDVGSYRCAAKNSLGEVESSIRLYEISMPQKAQTATRPIFSDEEEDEGSASEPEIGESGSRSPYSLDNTVHGHVGHHTPSASPALKTLKKRPQNSLTSAGIVSRVRGNAILVVFAILFRW
ncbi:lachesin isoform X2 [Cephus cinctus]|uniref:Lachesin isoform X2 n=1 Tax=Cephus cinctus TaxID=211228 RepID=A0AAJ7C0N5_CEPCN|nr:lachesin isoform X2 [Cephus cinctus]